MPTKVLTLCWLFRGDEVLLGMKKRGFGMGKWNGFGGKLQPDETIEQAALREFREEAGVEVSDIRKRGIITFEFENDPTLLEVHVFSTDRFTGEPAESDEMKPEWYRHDSLPYDSMWLDDRHWVPLLLAGKNFRGYFKFRGQEQILEQRLEEVASV